MIAGRDTRANASVGPFYPMSSQIMSEVLVRLSKDPEFESALMSLDDVQLTSLGKRIEDYLGLTGIVSDANLKLSMQVFRWTDRNSQLKCRVSGHVNNSQVERVIDIADSVVELPPTFWLSPRRLVKAAIISSVVPKPDIGNLRTRWKASMIDRIEIEVRESIDHAVGRVGSSTSKTIKRIIAASKMAGLISAIPASLYAFELDAAQELYERIVGGVISGCLSGALTGGSTFLLCCGMLIPAKEMANDPVGRRIMSIIGVQTHSGLRQATIVIGLLFLVLSIGLYAGLPHLPRK